MRTVILFLILTAAGCTSSYRSKVLGYGHHFKVKVYSGGKLVEEFESQGKPISEEHSDGYYFTDAKTGKLVEVSGNLVFEQL